MASETTRNSPETVGIASLPAPPHPRGRRADYGAGYGAGCGAGCGALSPSAPAIERVGYGKSHCMVVHAYYPLGETRVQREAQALLDAGFDVHVICLRDKGEPRADTDGGVTITRLPVSRHRGCSFAAQLAEYLTFCTLAFVTLSAMHLRRRFASVQIHNLPDFLVFSAVLPKLMGTPIILDLHDLMPELLAGRTGCSWDSWLMRIIRFQEQLACRFANHVVTVSEGWRQTLISRGVPSHRVSVVMNVPDARVFRPGQSADSSPRRQFNLLYHGTFTHRYGVDLTITAMAMLRDELPDLHLTLLGDGETRQELVEQVRALGLQQQVTISDGMVGVDRLPEEIRKADVGIVPNRTNIFTDGILPTKLLEYLAMGLPVVAAKTPTVAEYLCDESVAFFSPGDADELADRIRALYADPARRETLSVNARATCQQLFNWDKTASDYTQLVSQQSASAGSRAEKQPAEKQPAEKQSAEKQSAEDQPTGLAHRTTRTTTAVVKQRVDESVTIDTSRAADHPAWDAFLSSTPIGHHTQSSRWARVRANHGWRPIRIIGRRDGKIVGGAQILYKSVPRLGKIGYVTKGPVFPPGETELARMLIKEIEDATRTHTLRLVTVQPPGTTPDRPDYLDGPRFIESATEIAPRATLLLDVRPEPDEILAGFKRSTRYNVRLSGRKGVVVREGDATDLATFHQMLVATTARKRFKGYPLEYFKGMWNVLHPQGNLRLSLAEIDGEVVAAQIAIPFGNTVVNKLSVWSGRHGNCRPNEALQWSTIRWAHEQGYDVYDLEGIKLSAARALLQGKPRPKSPSQSVTSFKLGFCNQVVLGPSAQIYVPNGLVRWGVRHLYPRLNGRRWAKSLVKRLQTESNNGADRS